MNICIYKEMYTNILLYILIFVYFYDVHIYLLIFTIHVKNDILSVQTEVFRVRPLFRLFNLIQKIYKNLYILSKINVCTLF